jgi:hypothetical protein
MKTLNFDDPIIRCSPAELAEAPDYPEWGHYERVPSTWNPDIYYLTCFDGELVGINYYRENDNDWAVHLCQVNADGFHFFRGEHVYAYRTFLTLSEAQDYVDWLLNFLESALVMEALA